MRFGNKLLLNLTLKTMAKTMFRHYEKGRACSNNFSVSLFMQELSHCMELPAGENTVAKPTNLVYMFEFRIIVVGSIKR